MNRKSKLLTYTFHTEVVILGGGLAGLTLALQLKQAKPNLAISVLEKRADDAPVAIHKIGESVVELGSHYLHEVLGLREYLSKNHVLKRGFRFFYSPEEKEDFSRRVELGAEIHNPFPAFQLDRGLLENELFRLVEERGIHLYRGAKVQEIDMGGKSKSVIFQQKDDLHRIQADWIVDASGRRSMLRRQLNLDQPIDHHINAVWFRIKADIDIDDWSDNPIWKDKYVPGHRRLATNHLMGEGYWVWIIPLSSGYTSMGIVADPRYHPLENFHTAEKAITWLKVHEPIAHQILLPLQEQLADFRSFKQLAHDSKQLYAAEGWGLTGDAGAFLDPFYSPGTDFIGLSNTWLTDLIVRKQSGESIGLREKIYNHVHRELLQSWTSLYRNMYGIFGTTQVMLYKTIWDWCSYWAIPCLMFMNDGYTNLSVLKQYSDSKLALGKRFSALNNKIQTLFLQWAERGVPPASNKTIDYFGLDCINQFHLGLEASHAPQQLIQQVQTNLQKLEEIAGAIFRLASWHCNHTDLQTSVDPYAMDLSAPQVAFSSPNAKEISPTTQADMANCWLISAVSPTTSYV